MRTLNQLYSFVSSALFSSENERSESEERFKRPFKHCLPTPVGGVAGMGWYCHSYMGHVGTCRFEWHGFQAVYSGIGYMNTVNPLLSPPPLSSPLLIILHSRMGCRPIRLRQCCTQFRSLGVKILCALYLNRGLFCMSMCDR